MINTLKIERGKRQTNIKKKRNNEKGGREEEHTKSRPIEARVVRSVMGTGASSSCSESKREESHKRGIGEVTM